MVRGLCNLKATASAADPQDDITPWGRRQVKGIVRFSFFGALLSSFFTYFFVVVLSSLPLPFLLSMLFFLFVCDVVHAYREEKGKSFQTIWEVIVLFFQGDCILRAPQHLRKFLGLLQCFIIFLDVAGKLHVDRMSLTIGGLQKRRKT